GQEPNAGGSATFVLGQVWREIRERRRGRRQEVADSATRQPRRDCSGGNPSASQPITKSPRIVNGRRAQRAAQSARIRNPESAIVKDHASPAATRSRVGPATGPAAARRVQ